MDKFFEIGNQYAKESDWKDFALVKLCLCAMGVLMGIAVPQKHRKTAVWTAMGVFVVTYIPLMLKLFRIIEKNENAH